MIESACFANFLVTIEYQISELIIISTPVREKSLAEFKKRIFHLFVIKLN